MYLNIVCVFLLTLILMRNTGGVIARWSQVPERDTAGCLDFNNVIIKVLSACIMYLV